MPSIDQRVSKINKDLSSLYTSHRLLVDRVNHLLASELDSISGVGVSQHSITGPAHTAAGLTTGWVIRATGSQSFAWQQLQLSDIGGSHVLATNVALGAQHTISGASDGDVLRASGATTAAFTALSHGDLSDAPENAHHAAFVGLSDNADTSIDPAVDNRIQVTDDGKVNANASGNTLALSIDDSQIVHDSLSGGTAEDAHHAAFVALEDNAGVAVNPALDNRIQFTDDGIVNADASGNTMALSVNVNAISHDLLADVSINDHHNRDHVLADTTGLGSTHTTSGLTAGQVLRATGATTAAFGTLSYSEVGSRSHTLADTSGLGADHTTSGLTAGQVLRATGATTAAFGTVQYSEIGGTHVLATTSGLGPDHSTSGLTAGQVLRATGATTAAFQSIQIGDLPSLSSYAGAGLSWSSGFNVGGGNLITVNADDIDVSSASAGDSLIIAAQGAPHIPAYRTATNFAGTLLSWNATTRAFDVDESSINHDNISGVSANDHHNQVHAIVGGDHTASGLTTGHTIRATGATTFAWAQLQHSDLGSVSANQHHNQSHVLATDTALGPDHTVSGLTAGQALRAMSATTAKFVVLAHNDLGGISANQHHNQSHVLADTTALGTDHTVSGLTVGQVLRATGATTARFQAIQLTDIPSGVVLDTRTIGTVTPLEIYDNGGGSSGDLSANRTIAINGITTDGTNGYIPGPRSTVANGWIYRQPIGGSNITLTIGTSSYTWDAASTLADATWNTAPTVIYSGSSESSGGPTSISAATLGGTTSTKAYLVRIAFNPNNTATNQYFGVGPTATAYYAGIVYGHASGELFAQCCWVPAGASGVLYYKWNFGTTALVYMEVWGYIE